MVQEILGLLFYFSIVLFREVRLTSPEWMASVNLIELRAVPTELILAPSPSSTRSDIQAKIFDELY